MKFTNRFLLTILKLTAIAFHELLDLKITR